MNRLLTSAPEVWWSRLAAKSVNSLPVLVRYLLLCYQPARQFALRIKVLPHHFMPLRGCVGQRGVAMDKVVFTCMTMASGLAASTSWKFLTLANLTRPLKLRHQHLRFSFQWGALFSSSSHSPGLLMHHQS